MILFLCSREKLAFCKNIITIEPPPAKYAYSDSFFFIIALWCEFASTFNVLTLCGCNVSCCRIILWRVSDTLGLRFLHSTLPLVLMGIHNLVTSAIWIEVIVFMLLFYMWFTSVINPRVLCVSAYRSRDDTEHRDFGPFGSWSLQA